MNKLKKLNLGCDRDYREGWTNLDFHTNLKCDIVHNLNDFPWPFKDNEFSEIYLGHVLEHLKDIPRVMNELQRISEKNGRIFIVTPYFNSFNAFRDVTHISFFTWDSLSPFCGFVSSRERKNVGYLPRLFKYNKRELEWANSNKYLIKQFCNFMNWLVNLSPDFVERRIPWWITIEAIKIDLCVLK
jgi:ubiquinone/menaquinone biosynthesis C-methylase UbiE